MAKNGEHWFRMLLSAAEKDLLTQWAKEAQMKNTSEYIKYVIRRYHDKHIPQILPKRTDRRTDTLCVRLSDNDNDYVDCASAELNLSKADTVLTFAFYDAACRHAAQDKSRDVKKLPLKTIYELVETTGDTEISLGEIISLVEGGDIYIDENASLRWAKS